MRKLFLISMLTLLAAVTFGQRVIVDTLQGNETVNFEVMQAATQIQAVCTQLGGTSDGKLYLQGSVDGTSFVNVTEATGLVKFYPNDTLTITNVAIWLIGINQKLFNYYRVKGTGTANDTTKVVINCGKN